LFTLLLDLTSESGFATGGGGGCCDGKDNDNDKEDTVHNDNSGNNNCKTYNHIVCICYNLTLALTWNG
jgi:hypothetical protein